jgi:hypothetical protein
MLPKIKRLLIGCRLVWLLCLLLIATAALATGNRSRNQAPSLKITAMKAMLFWESNGTFSPDVSETESADFTVPSLLWNTPMGGGPREGTASSVLVTVEVTSAESYKHGRSQIEFTASYVPLDRASGAIIVRRRAAISINENGKYIAGFWLYQTGCHPVKLSARIVGQSRSTTVRRAIRFGCGE